MRKTVLTLIAIIWIQTRCFSQTQTFQGVNFHNTHANYPAGFHDSHLNQWNRLSLGLKTEGNSFRIEDWRLGSNNLKTLFSVNIDGKVGIGTVSPESKLHVQTNNVGIKSQYSIATFETDDAQVDLISSSAGNWGSSLNFIEGNGGSNTDIWSIVRRTSGGGSSLRFNYGITNNHINSNILTLSTNGNAGIGTVNPDAKLDVHGDIKLNGGTQNFKISNLTGSETGYGTFVNYGGIAIDGNDGGNRQMFLFSDGSGSSNIFTVTSSTDAGSTWNSRFAIQQNGLVGIGTSNPGEKLTLHQGRFKVSNNSAQDLYIWSYANEPAKIMTGGNNISRGIQLGRDNTPLFLLDQVSIGTSNIAPTGYKLAVDGKAIMEEIKVELSQTWPDFVFENDYDLLPLEEVEKHIQEKGHLPEIPDEEEVMENGINLGEMNAKLLQKIEELTLYLIDQNKQLQEQKTEIEELKRMNGEFLKKTESK